MTGSSTDEAGRELYVIGTPPNLAGQVCQAFLCQELWYEGQLADPTNTIWFRVNDQWNLLYFEADTIFWQTYNQEPIVFDLEDGSEIKLSNLGQEVEIEGIVLKSYTHGLLSHGVAVEFIFSNDVIISIASNGEAGRVSY